jgi:hypothetical protein
MSLRLNPTTGKVVEVYTSYFADRFRRQIAQCQGDQQIPEERPRCAFVKEDDAVSALLDFWSAQDEASRTTTSYIFANEVEACFSFLAGDSSCTHGKDALLLAMARFKAKSEAILKRRTVVDDNTAWVSLTSHVICLDGSRIAMDSEHLIYLDFSRCAVNRLYVIADVVDVARYLECAHGAGSPLIWAKLGIAEQRAHFGAKQLAVVSAPAPLPALTTVRRFAALHIVAVGFGSVLVGGLAAHIRARTRTLRSTSLGQRPSWTLRSFAHVREPLMAGSV